MNYICLFLKIICCDSPTIIHLSFPFYEMIKFSLVLAVFLSICFNLVHLFAKNFSRLKYIFRIIIMIFNGERSKLFTYETSVSYALLFSRLKYIKKIERIDLKITIKNPFSIYYNLVN